MIKKTIFIAFLFFVASAAILNAQWKPQGDRLKTQWTGK
jgi:hypothetical protein